MYAKVRYREVYPGVDLVYYGNQRQLEHDFIIAPHADPSSITLNLAGAEKLFLDTQGHLVLRVKEGEAQFEKPRIYQDVGGVRREIPGSYLLKGAHQVGFQVATYDTSRPLVIDPVLFYSTFLGGGGDDFGHGIAVDSAGNAYVTGPTTSANFPTTSGVAQSALRGGSDVFVTKLNPTGSGLVYSTYIGGTSNDGGGAIAVDSSGSAYVTGNTSSSDFPTTPGAFQTTFAGPAGAGDAFVTKLNPTGSALLYSTFLGGNGDDVGIGIAIDAIGNAYVAGGTSSTNFPTTPGAFQTTCRAQRCTPFTGTGAGFVTKLNPTGTAVVYSTYLSGSNGDTNFARGIAVDLSDNAYVTGETNSSDFPTTPGAFQSVSPKPGGICAPSSAYVTKINTLGTGLVYSTYLGAVGNFPSCSGFNDNGFGIAIDSMGNAYVSGNTVLTNFPTTAGAFQTTYGPGSNNVGNNAFVTKLNPLGTGLVYSTYLGGSGSDQGFGIAVDSSFNAYVTGSTTSTNFPTANPVQAAKRRWCRRLRCEGESSRFGPRLLYLSGWQWQRLRLRHRAGLPAQPGRLRDGLHRLDQFPDNHGGFPNHLRGWKLRRLRDEDR
jgi:beta-propeller repeat-containing protein